MIQTADVAIGNAKLIDHLLFKLKFDVLEQAIQHRELMGWDEIQEPENMHMGEMDCGQKGKKKGYMLNKFHGSVSNKYCGCKGVQCGCWRRGFVCVIKGKTSSLLEN